MMGFLCIFVIAHSNFMTTFNKNVITRLCIGPTALFPTNTTLSKISLSEIAPKLNELQD